MIQHPYASITRTSALLCVIILLTACASAPEKQRPEITVDAYKNLQIGVLNYNDSKYQQARSHFNVALTLFRSVDHHEGIASSCLNIAKVHLERDELSLAKEYLSIAESLISESDISSLKDHLAIAQSSLAIANDDHATAKIILEPMIGPGQNTDIKLAALQNRIRVAFAEDDVATAKDTITTFSASLSDHRDTAFQARLNRFQAILESDRAEAEKKYQMALDIYRKHALKPGIASTLQEWGDRLIEYEDLPGANDRLLRALFVRQSMEDVAGSIRLLISLNRLYIKQDDVINSNKAVRWINRLSAARFNQWDNFIEAFNRYPAI